MKKDLRTFLSLSPYAVFAIVLLLFNAGFLWFNFQTVRGHQNAIEHANQVLNEVDALLAAAKNSETGIRGFALTKDISFLESYKLGQIEIWRHFNLLKVLTKENPVQQSSLNALEIAIRDRLDALEIVYQKYLQNSSLNILDPVYVKAGQIAMETLQHRTGEMKREENNLLQRQASRVDSSQRNFIVSLFGTTFLSILVIGWSLTRTWRNQRDAQQEALFQAQESDRKAKIVQLSKILSGQLSLNEVGDQVLRFLSLHVDFSAASFYTVQDQMLQQIGSFAKGAESQRDFDLSGIKLGEGLLGEAAQRQGLWEIFNIPEDYFWIVSGLGQAQPRVLSFLPLFHEDRNIGLLELASFSSLGADQHQLLESFRGVIADGLNSAHWRNQIQNLLLKTQQQSEELQSQQEELRASNEELEQQAEELKNQQDELRATNESLEEQAKVLEKQKDELTKANQYKSEFLARMSHELRTPLNSLLILATLLMEDKEKNLSARQLEFAQSIYGAGHDLLGLINDILDLSKIDAKKLVLRPENFTVNSLAEHLKKTFDIQFSSKNIDFSISIDEGLSDQVLWSDRQRIEQVLRNFLSNALKFTEKGEVLLRVQGADKPNWIRWQVKDTGIGIPEEKKGLIFEAFEQADSSISRKYGGTGLGLSISKELSILLGGSIQVDSRQGEGSSFTLEIPMRLPGGPVEKPLSQPQPVPEARSTKKVLVVEDNKRQREAIIQLITGADIQISALQSGEEAFLSLQKEEYDCVILDLELPDISGFEVLKKLRALSRKIPPIVIYTGREITELEEQQLRHFSESIIIKGARSPERLVEEVNHFLLRKEEDKPQNKSIVDLQFQDKSLAGKTVLLVDDDLRSVFALTNGLESWGLNVRIGRNGLEGLQLLEEDPTIDVALMDLMMPKMDGYEAIRRIRQHKNWDKLPIVALTAKTATENRAKVLEAGANDYLAKPVHLANLRSVLKVWLGEHQ